MNINEVEKLAREKMNEHGLRFWKLSMIRSLSVAGRCWRHKKLLELSIDYMEVYDYDQVMDTILHEIAHALDTTRYKTVNRANGGKRKIQLHHDDVWKAIARSIGCSAMRCVDPKAPKPLRQQTARYKGICPNGHETQRQRLGDKIMTGTSCGKCYSKSFRPEYRFDWYDNGKLIHRNNKPVTVVATPRPQPVPKFVSLPPRPKVTPKPVKPIDEFYWTDTPEGIAALKSLLS